MGTDGREVDERLARIRQGVGFLAAGGHYNTPMVQDILWLLDEVGRRRLYYAEDGDELLVFGPGFINLQSSPCFYVSGSTRADLQALGATEVHFG